MDFSLTVLGSSSATPTKLRNPSAQIVKYNNKLFLVDCGEGTQMQMLKYGIKSNRINHIFISHLHGDHYLGLPGLIFTFHLMGRKKELHIFSPPELENIIKLHISVANTVLSYPLVFHDISKTHSCTIYEDNDIEVSAFALKHRIPTYGFFFKEKKKAYNIIKSAIAKYELSVEDIQKAKSGETVYDIDGKIIPHHLICKKPSLQRSFAYCSDTAYHKEIVKNIKGVSLLYHEATFAEDMKETAAEKYHATAAQAASIAKEAKAKKLLIGHFSARYKTTEKLLSEARHIFPDTAIAEEGEEYEILPPL